MTKPLNIIILNIYINFMLDIPPPRDKMGKKSEAVALIEKKLNNETFLSYKEIAEVCDYHPKYILRLKKEILDGTIQIEHGNKNRDPINKMTDNYTIILFAISLPIATLESFILTIISPLI